MSADAFWSPFETKISSYKELLDVIDGIIKKAKDKKIQFAWRGQVDASWPLHSSLYRRSYLTKKKVINEGDLYKIESDILIELHRWGLHSPQNAGRLSILKQLAMLQHYGSPTRMIDITFNAWIGAWFAVEQKWDNGIEINQDKDSRLFAVDITNRLINENNDHRKWEDDLSRPWRPDREDALRKNEWTTSVYAWKPSNLDGRIFAQNGGFIFGGVPGSKNIDGGPFQFPKSTTPGDGKWKIDEVRQYCCLALRPHKFETNKGGAIDGALYTFRIAAEAKREIRENLEKMFGYKHSTIYPDYTGFSMFGTPALCSK